MFIFKYINGVLFFMNNNITKETDIYQIIIEDNLNEIIIENEKYSNYIIYEDINNVKYRVFIHDNLIYNNIKFYIDSYTIDNKLIILSYSEDAPLYILYEDNDTDENNYITETDKIPDVVGDENDYNDYEAIEYESILLKYNSLRNEYVDIENKSYKIYNKENSTINSIVRHFKVIKSRFYDYSNVITKYCLYFKDNNKLYNWYKDYNSAMNEYDSYISKHGNILYLINEHIYINEISHDPNNYYTNLYYMNGIDVHNSYKDETVDFHIYHTVNELKTELENKMTLSTYNYINGINENNVNSIDMLNSIDYDLNNSNYFYIRFAPSPDMKYTQAKRVFQIRHMYTDNEDSSYLNILVQRSEIPVYNDNLIYSKNECNIVDDRLNLNIIE